MGKQASVPFGVRGSVWESPYSCGKIVQVSLRD